MRLVAPLVLVLLAAASTVSAFDAYKLLLGEVLEGTCQVGHTLGTAPNVNFTQYEKLEVDGKLANFSLGINPCVPAIHECGKVTLGSYLTLAAAQGSECLSFDTDVVASSTYENSTVTMVFTSTGVTNAKATVVIRCGAATGLNFAYGNLTTATNEAHLEFESDAPCVPAVTTPAPATPGPDTGDDGGKLSTGAVVGIIAGSAVVVVSLGVAITKFRASSKSDDATYNRV